MSKQIRIAIGTDAFTGFRIRLSLIRLDENGIVESDKAHSMAIEPGTDMDAARATLEAHLAMPFEQSGIPGAPWPAIPDAEWGKAVAMVAIWHPEEVVKAHREKVEAARVAEEATRERMQAEAEEQRDVEARAFMARMDALRQAEPVK